MADRPIIFSTPMVQALLAGRKTQTRRLVKKPAALDALAVFGATMLLQPGCADLLPFAPGDRLWIRETWHPDGDPGPSYRADYHPASGDGWGWKPSIHMPRWASRLTLLVTEVRVQRLQGINEEDAKAEGLATVTKDGKFWKWGIPDRDGLPGTDDVGWPWVDWCRDPRDAYRKIWESLHGPGSWEANPWVAAISFEVARR